MLVENLANFGDLSDTIEVIVAVVMMLGGIWLTYRIQQWADRAGGAPPAANTAMGGAADHYEAKGMRE